MVDPLQLSLMDELFETDSYDQEVDWGKFPQLEAEPEDELDATEVPEHIQQFLEVATHGADATLPVQKSGVAQRLATGWASVLTDEHGQELVDREGDSVDEADLVKAVAKFMTLPQSERVVKDTHGLTGVKHPVGTVVESLVVTRMLKAALGLPEDFPTGWLATVHVTDDNVWGKVERGEYRMFSMGGKGQREPLA